jgi:hypothetical protein
LNWVRPSLGIAIAFAAIAIALLVWQPTQLFHRSEYKVATQVIERVETFRRAHGQLPASLQDVGFSDPDLKVFYQKTTDQEYRVWFGTWLGESEVYDSERKQWRSAS